MIWRWLERRYRYRDKNPISDLGSVILLLIFAYMMLAKESGCHQQPQPQTSPSQTAQPATRSD